jgi:hypothetical protein
MDAGWVACALTTLGYLIFCWHPFFGFLLLLLLIQHLLLLLDFLLCDRDWTTRPQRLALLLFLLAHVLGEGQMKPQQCE